MLDVKIDANKLDDLVAESERIKSLADALQTALDHGKTSSSVYGGAAYILWEKIYDFTKNLEELSCQE